MKILSESRAQQKSLVKVLEKNLREAESKVTGAFKQGKQAATEFQQILLMQQLDEAITVCTKPNFMYVHHYFFICIGLYP